MLNQAHRAGAAALRGVFLPTPRNAPAAGFYARQGFEQGMDESLWTLMLDAPEAQKPYPIWLTVTESEENSR